jgi:hypothetical protein
MLPDTLAKFCVNMHNSENEDTDKKHIRKLKAFWLKLLCKVQSYYSSFNSNCNFPGASLTATEKGFSKICVFVAWL